MSLPHAPVEKGWGKEEWIIWNKGEHARFPIDIEDFDIHQYYQQLKDALQWAAPDAVTLKQSTLPSENGEKGCPWGISSFQGRKRYVAICH
jgi:hypothetical protein